MRGVACLPNEVNNRHELQIQLLSLPLDLSAHGHYTVDAGLVLPGQPLQLVCPQPQPALSHRTNPRPPPPHPSPPTTTTTTRVKTCRYSCCWPSVAWAAPAACLLTAKASPISRDSQSQPNLKGRGGVSQPYLKGPPSPPPLPPPQPPPR